MDILDLAKVNRAAQRGARREHRPFVVLRRGSRELTYTACADAPEWLADGWRIYSEVQP